MMKMYIRFLLSFGLLYSRITMADYTWSPVNENQSVYKTFVVTDSTAVPDTWVDLGQLYIGTASSLSGGLSPCLTSNFMCTAGSISLGFNGKAGYILYLSREPTTITDNDGNHYMITVAFPDKGPVVGVHMQNSAGGNTWNTVANIDKSLSLPSDGKDAAHASSDASGYCGNVNGCEYRIGSYMHTNSGMPHVYVKIPKNLSASKISFQNVSVLELSLYLSNKAHNTVSPVSAKLYLSGTISVPQRCYVKADKSDFDFGTVYSNNATGLIGQRAMALTTDCYYPPDNTQQYLKMEAVSGGLLNDDSVIYQVDSDSSLGVVFNINNSPQCNSVSDNYNMFNKEYLIRSISYQKKFTVTDTLNVALCKYGVPKVTGTKNVVLRLTSRWVSE
mgnify:CR=1 FL=1